MYQSLDLQFFGTTTEIQSGLDVFRKSRLVVTFLNNLGVTGMLCSFTLVLKENVSKEIPESTKLEFLEKFWANSLALSDAEYNTLGPLNAEGIVNLTLLKTLLSRELSFLEVIDSFILLV